MSGLIFLLGTFVLVNGLPTSKIVGGHDADDGKYPYIFSLQYNDEHSCAGVIFDEHHVITTTSCTNIDVHVDVSKLRIVVGSNSLSGGQKYKTNADNVQIHADYDNYFKQSDIAIIKTTEPIQFNDKVKPINITFNNVYDTRDYPVTLAGWGYTSENGPTSEKLQEIDLKILDRETCKRSLWVSNSQICTLENGNSGPCYYDGGSPLTTDGIFIGLLSYGKPCSSGSPMVYTIVHKHMDWINSAIESLSKK